LVIIAPPLLAGEFRDRATSAAAAHTESAHNRSVDRDRHASADRNQPLGRGRCGQPQGRVSLKQRSPPLGSKAEAGGGVRLVVGDLTAQQRCAVHPHKALLHPALVDDRHRAASANLNARPDAAAISSLANPLVRLA
jgi:hypothetical protein